MVVEMVNKVNQRVSTIIGDDDAATISRLRHEVDPKIEKQSDRNHLNQNRANQLYVLQKVHKSLSSKVIRCIQKCWNYMIAQNVGNEDGISTGLDATMYKHPFGDHSSCGDWCSHRDNHDMNYKSLPHGKCLSNLNVQRFLLDLFSRYKGICKKVTSYGVN